MSRKDINYIKPEPNQEDILLERRNKELILDSGNHARNLSDIQHSPNCRAFCLVLLGVFLPPVLLYKIFGKCDERFWCCFWFTFLGWLPGIIYAFHCTEI